MTETIRNATRNNVGAGRNFPPHLYRVGLLAFVHRLAFASQASPQTTCFTTRYCAGNGLTAVSGDCAAGYYCTSGAIISNPVDQYYGDLCTAGHYCETGSAWPEPCPPGTYYGAEVFQRKPTLNYVRVEAELTCSMGQRAKSNWEKSLGIATVCSHISMFGRHLGFSGRWSCRAQPHTRGMLSSLIVRDPKLCSMHILLQACVLQHRQILAIG